MKQNALIAESCKSDCSLVAKSPPATELSFCCDRGAQHSKQSYIRSFEDWQALSLKLQ